MYPNGLTFADYAGPKTYDCKKCNKKLRYAKFFKPDGKILTMDGKEPDGKYDKTTNVFSTSILAENKELHTCYNIEWPRTDTLDSSTVLPKGFEPQKIDEDLLDKWHELLNCDDEIHVLALYQVIKQQPDIPDGVKGAATSAKETNLNLIRLIRVLVERKE